MRLGLDGKMNRPIQVTLIGAGSFFTSSLIRDLLRIPQNQGGRIALVDLDRKRLALSARFVQRLVDEIGGAKWKVESTTERRKVLKGTDYLLNCIEVHGMDCIRHDNDLPAEYGVYQCVGDTVGPGGLFKGLRTIPVFLEILRDAERLCPEAWVLNYTNPMAMMCQAAAQVSPMKVVGLCHSVQGTSRLLAERAEVPYEEMEWDCAGINHFAWFTTLRHEGQDLYPRLMRKAKQDLAGKASNPKDAGDLVRKDMMLHFGAFITESSGHLSEYLPWYRGRREVLQDYLLRAKEGRTRDYANHWPAKRREVDRRRKALVDGTEEFSLRRSYEYASWIIEAREKGVPLRIHANFPNSFAGNDCLISNLPAQACVEVATLVDRDGLRPLRFGALPPQMAALCDSNVRMQELGAQAAVSKSKELAFYALTLDPLTSARCTPAESRELCERLFKAEAAYLPGYH